MQDCTHLTNKDRRKDLTETIAKFQMTNDYKGMIFTDFLDSEKGLPPLAEDFIGPIKEILKLHRG